MCTVPKPYPREFREDVIRVTRSREPGVRIKDVAADFGISESCLQNWMGQVDGSPSRRQRPTLRSTQSRAPPIEQCAQVPSTARLLNRGGPWSSPAEGRLLVQPRQLVWVADVVDAADTTFLDADRQDAVDLAVEAHDESWAAVHVHTLD
jgi:transposase-like protein